MLIFLGILGIIAIVIHPIVFGLYLFFFAIPMIAGHYSD